MKIKTNLKELYKRLEEKDKSNLSLKKEKKSRDKADKWNIISTKELKKKLTENHSYPYNDRRSLSYEECFVEYFPDVKLINPRDEFDKKKFSVAKRTITEALKKCEEDEDSFVGLFWRPDNGWRICTPDHIDLKWKIIRSIYPMIRGWQRKAENHKTKFNIELTEKDLDEMEEELEKAETERKEKLEQTLDRLRTIPKKKKSEEDKEETA